MNALMESQNVRIALDLNEFERFVTQRNPTKIAVIVDENTHEHCYPLLKPFLPTEHLLIEIQSGEQNKTLTTCSHIWQQMTDYAMDRKGMVINLGGGVIGDMGGFCATTYKRGIDFIQMPTTLLSQVDASVGGKLGIDFQQFKNHIGTFKIPNLVYIYIPFLQTLSARQLLSGYAEVIKHCLIADADKWQTLQQSNYHTLDWQDIVQHSVAVKAQVVDTDPYERGLRKILNFGHTIGHAIESYYLTDDQRALLHGEAIAIGMMCEAYLAQQKGFIGESDLNRITQYIDKLYPTLTIKDEEVAAIAQLTRQDKKNEGGKIQCTLLEQVGKANFNQPITLNEVSQALQWYQGL
ncbi:3-dehydroquinate synthase [Microscilla marina]|uniref:3-dehydroquinate synthase n=1 Tax=Microscilla marina ATCC 23134 TaxID=313606 RepID=A1ZDB9_MICM2|nr:3-dehydroquinate synthase [Microscilla marina]EAY31658.1 3-dehydroquinate synthase [Microscilla marina ATCC 23134]